MMTLRKNGRNSGSVLSKARSNSEYRIHHPIVRFLKQQTRQDPERDAAELLVVESAAKALAHLPQLGKSKGLLVRGARLGR